MRIGFVDDDRCAERAAALGVFGLKQVALAGMWAQYLAGGSNFESLGHRFIRLDTFRTSHNNFLSKEREIYDLFREEASGIFR
jgi:hypothetical protein